MRPNKLYMKVYKPANQAKKYQKLVKFVTKSFFYTQVASKNKFHVCEHFTGHGVGQLLHMPPMIPHHLNNSKGVMLPGMVFTIEPIFTLFEPTKYVQWQDNFTIASPGNPSA